MIFYVQIGWIELTYGIENGDPVLVVNGSRLRQFWERKGQRDAEGPLKAWHAEASEARWQSANDIRVKYPDAIVLGPNAVAFGLVRQRYRLVTAINFEIGYLLIETFATQVEFDRLFNVAVGGEG